LISIYNLDLVSFGLGLVNYGLDLGLDTYGLGLVNYGLDLGLDTYGLGLGGSGLDSITVNLSAQLASYFYCSRNKNTAVSSTS